MSKLLLANPAPDHEFPCRIMFKDGLKANYIQQTLVRMRITGTSTWNRWGFLEVARHSQEAAES